MRSPWLDAWADPFAEDIDGELRRYERVCELDDTEEEVEPWPSKESLSDDER